LKALKQIQKFPAWLDAKNKRVVLVAESCKADYPLEFFITTKQRAYESVLMVDAEHHEQGKGSLFFNIQLALLLCGAKPGHPSYYKDDKTTVATGDEIVIEVRWKNKEGKIEKTDARNWIRDVKTKKSPEKTWVSLVAGWSTMGRGAGSDIWPMAGSYLRAEQPHGDAGSAGRQRRGH